MRRGAHRARAARRSNPPAERPDPRPIPSCTESISVGFCSQNVVYNFISGLILMVERPIKVGDIVDVDGTYVRGELMGARSTRIRH